MNIFFLYLRGMSETGKKFQIITISLKKMRILVILGHFWPVFGLFRSGNVFLMVFLSIFFLVPSELSKTGKKIWKNDNKVENNANFGHFRPFLACFWPVMAPIEVLNDPNEYVFPSSAWNE